jgi:methanogenic corrinoid protein MtbC1
VTDDDLAVARLGIMATLREGDAATAYRLVLRLLDDGYPMPVVVDDVLAPIQWESGRRWETGDATISEEHVSTAAVETLVSMLTGGFDQPVDAEVVVVVCAEGDTHSLPARLAAAVLAYEGYRTLFLGTAVPAADLAGYLATTATDALVVSCARPASLLGARACIAAGHGAGVPVVVGGRAFGEGDERWQHLGADARAPRLSALPELLQTWRPDPGLAEQRAAPVPPSAEALMASRARVAGAVPSMIAARHQPEVADHPLLASATGELVDVLAVSLYLGDAALLAGHAEWLAGLLESRAGLQVSAQQLLGGLADAAAPVTPHAADLIDAACRPAG